MGLWRSSSEATRNAADDAAQHYAPTGEPSWPRLRACDQHSYSGSPVELGVIDGQPHRPHRSLRLRRSSHGQGHVAVRLVHHAENPLKCWTAGAHRCRPLGRIGARDGIGWWAMVSSLPRTRAAPGAEVLKSAFAGPNSRRRPSRVTDLTPTDQRSERPKPLLSHRAGSHTMLPRAPALSGALAWPRPARADEKLHTLQPTIQSLRRRT